MRILILSWHFPPSSEIAGKVTFRLARQLVARGHQVTAVVPSLDEIRAVDPSFEDGAVGEINVERVRPWPDLLAVMANLRKKVRRGPAANGGAPLSTRAAAGGMHPIGLHGLLRDLRSYPDLANRWIVPASRALRRIALRDHVDVVLSVAPYFSTHLAARRACHALPGVRWWAWSHDPASGNAFDLRPGNWRRPHIERWEGAVVRRCDGIAVTTEELADDFGLRFGRRPIVAGCGFAPEELPPPIDPPATGPLVLTHAGTLYGHRTPMPLLETIADLRARNVIGKDGVKLRLIGDRADLGGEPLEAAVARLDLGGIVSLEQAVPQGEAVRAIQASHVGVVLAEDQPLQVPAKTYDYAGLHRPILALGDGATAALIERHQLGVIASRETLATVLGDLVAEFRRDHLRYLTERVVANAPALTVARQLAVLMDALERSSGRRAA